MAAKYSIMLSARVPSDLKEWYDRRARELGISTSELVRRVLEGPSARKESNA